MTAYALIGAGCLLVAGLIWLVVWLVKRATAAEAARNIAEHDNETLERMAAADAGKPADLAELERRLRASRF